ncbi:MAG: tRNA lysidine(34) synthetase TilS [Candidatus Omnitrophica bacterium]|nr:tRNA lysidine(34) synthetase TilS [Candidatus Omnitrophota bacterium]
MKKRNLIEQVLKTVRSYEMLKAGDTVLAAVSGGPDSVFLVHALSRLKNKLKLKNIAICNLDHGLRAGESKADSAFAGKLAKEIGLEFFHKSIDLKNMKHKGISIEEAAREERYKFFASASALSGAGIIATGHTLDDQAETILMRFIKGSALKGIVGIAPVREFGKLKVVRPLIEIEKYEIVDYLNSANIGYRIDSTNVEPIYFRNVVRSQILPFLERYNPKLKRSLFNLAEHLREDFNFIEQAKSKILAGKSVPGAMRVEVRLKDIAVQPRALQKEILRDLLEDAGGELKRLSFRHWKEMESLIRHKSSGNSVDLPGGIRLTRFADKMVFSKNMTLPQ